MPTIRVASAADSQSILDIYAPFCTESSSVSFEIEVPKLADMESRIAKTLSNLPWLVYEEDGVLLGYAYAGEHKARAAYKWSVEASVYLHVDARGRGVGKQLYTCLFAILEKLGYFNIYAGITLPNPGSLALHKAMGFEQVGVYKNVGYKAGAWHDVSWLVLPIRAHTIDPQNPLSFGEIDPQTLSKLLSCDAILASSD